MKKIYLCIVGVALLAGCAVKANDYFTVNCTAKTVRPPSAQYNPQYLGLIKKRINYICQSRIGLVTLNEKDIAELQQ